MTTIAPPLLHHHQQQLQLMPKLKIAPILLQFLMSHVMRRASSNSIRSILLLLQRLIIHPLSGRIIQSSTDLDTISIDTVTSLLLLLRRQPFRSHLLT